MLFVIKHSVQPTPKPKRKDDGHYSQRGIAECKWGTV